MEFKSPWNYHINPGVLELGYIAVLEAAAERIESSNLSTWTTTPVETGVFSNGSVAQQVVYVLGKIEVIGSNPVGASMQVPRPGEVKSGYKVVTY